jgi:hypothetical protein
MLQPMAVVRALGKGVATALTTPTVAPMGAATMAAATMVVATTNNTAGALHVAKMV